MNATNDMRGVIVPKSDQMNADDLLAGPITVTIREVSIRPGTEQPVSIHYEGDQNKPYKPCKSMCRVLVAAWGPDAKAYVGRSLALYCDPKVKWGGMLVGGIRISHLSHLDHDLVMALTETKGRRAPFVVKPLTNTASGNSGKVEMDPEELAMHRQAAEQIAALGLDEFRKWWPSQTPAVKAALKPYLADLQKTAQASSQTKGQAS